MFDLGWWFIKCLNENLAGKANGEDDCKGRFWESRHKSQALLDEKALLSSMAYVDLNPVRAGMAATPEESEHTSINQRAEPLSDREESRTKPRLVPLVDASNIETQDEKTICRIRLMDYLQLVDATGGALREDKRGAISAQAADILERLGIDQKAKGICRSNGAAMDCWPESGVFAGVEVWF